MIKESNRSLQEDSGYQIHHYDTHQIIVSLIQSNHCKILATH